MSEQSQLLEQPEQFPSAQKALKIGSDLQREYGSVDNQMLQNFKLDHLKSKGHA